jgi:uncharacterized RDD family membrane protein YckC
MRWLTQDAAPGDVLFFAFSGHGRAGGSGGVIGFVMWAMFFLFYHVYFPRSSKERTLCPRNVYTVLTSHTSC